MKVINVARKYIPLSGGGVDVVVNPTGAERLEIGTSGFGRPCPGDPTDTKTRNNGETIYLLGCVTGAGIIELRRESDYSLVRTYNVTISDPSPTWDAVLTPDPTTRSFVDDGEWHSFMLTSGGEVEVVVNPTGTPRLEISTSGIGDLCPASEGDDKTIDNGETIYLAGCVSGSADIQLRRTTDDSLVRTYTVTVGSTSTPSVCNPLRSFDADRRSGSSVRVSWSDPLSGRLASTGRQVNIRKWVRSAWQFERVIDEPSSRNYSWHLGMDADSYYAYRAKNVCGSVSSTWSSWETERPWTDRSDGSGGSEGHPEPTRVPGGSGGAASNEEDEEDERPPTPRD